jgi:alkylglycerol monooxygenase
LINQLNSSYIYLYAGFIFISIYALTELMDRNPYAIAWEILRSSFGIAFLIDQDDWFGISNYFPPAIYMIEGYFVISIIITGWFVIKHKKEDQLQLQTS